MTSAPATRAPQRGGTELSRAAEIARAVAVAPIVAYRRLLSPLVGARCKYEPSCSRYAEQAIREFGILRGLVLAGWRLLRCNPWSHGGFDPVRNQSIFSAPRSARDA